MIDTKPKGKVAIFYTDGSAKPTNPGPTGSGVHGFVFSETSEKPTIITNHFLTYINKLDGNQQPPKATITTQGYKPCDKDGNVVGRFPWVKPDFFLDVVGSFELYETNNVGELQAMFYAMQAALEVEGLEQLHLLMDSQYALDTISVNAERWRQNNWMTSQGKLAANISYIKRILELRDRLHLKNVQITYVKVAAHTDDIGNNSADYLARVGSSWSEMVDVRVDFRWSVGRKYWDNEIERHPMLHASRFIYNRKHEMNSNDTVYMVEPAGTDLTIGKRDHEGYAIVRLAKPCSAYSALLRAQKSYNQFQDWPMKLETSRLYNKFVQKWLLNYGAGCLAPDRRTGVGLYFLDEGVVAKEHNPPALIYRATEVFENLTERLEDYVQKTYEEGDKSFTSDDYHGIQTLDITEDFYETVEKKVGKDVVQKKLLRKEIVVGYQQHFIDIELTLKEGVIKRKLPITLGMDLPPRNSLKKLEDEDPAVILITWRTAPNAFRYACIVEATSGIGIWSNYYCDRFFV